jgi:predicted HTH domain antitoxin
MAFAKHQVDLPKDLYDLLGRDDQANQAIKEFTVLGLFQEGRISAGKAAESLNLSLKSFAALLARKGINHFRMDEQGWLEELTSVMTLSQDGKPVY